MQNPHPIKRVKNVRTGHCITIGQTESGKTILNKRLARRYQRAGIVCVVLDPLGDPEWKDPSTPDQNFVMLDDSQAFLDLVFDPDRCLQAAIFIDEAGMSISKYSAEYDKLTTVSRHFGHVVHVIAQRAQMVSATLRSQCRTCFAFNVNGDDAKLYSKDFNCPQILDAPNLVQGEFIQATRFENSKRFRLW